jgi:hypothetical protein
VEIRCREIHSTDVVLEVNGQPEPVVLKIDDEKSAP